MATVKVLLPRLLPAPDAALYLGVSQSTLSKLGLLRKELLSKRLYDRLDLDAYADSLRYEGAEDEGCAEDRMFGVGT